jgi:hypothetical protein
MKLLLFFPLLFLFNVYTYAQRDTSNLKERDITAQNKLINFKSSLNEKNIGNFGFNSIDDLNNAELSKPPFQLSIIPLNQLKNYTSNTNVNSMFIQSSQFIYPIINSKNRSATNAMILDYPQTKLKWEIVSIGKSKLLAEAVYNQYKKTPNNYFIASIPFLNLDFITFRTGSSVMMIPVVSDPQNKLEAGVPVPAEKIFSTYSIAAKKYNGLPM